MQARDVLGRRRHETQNRGLRSLFPKLPPMYRSRLIRIAMTQTGWAQLDGLVAQSRATTAPRAYGEVLEDLLATSAGEQAVLSRLQEQQEERTRPVTVTSGQDDWQTWQMHKERTLLAAASQ